MKPIPFPTGKNINIPESKPEEVKVPIAKIEPVQIPAGQELTKSSPTQSELLKQEPNASELNKEQPVESALNKEQPVQSELNKEMPLDVNIENCIEIDGNLYEIKPTKLKYFRNKMAGSYNVIKAIPLNEFLTYEKGVIDAEKDADQILFDFLVAVFDDADFVKDHYEDLTADDVEKVIKIFGRLNHIDEKEEKVRKNKEAQAAKR